MTATLERPSRRDDQPEPLTDPPRSRIDGAEAAMLLATLVVLVAAVLPLTRVYVGLDFLRAVLAAVLLSVGLSWGSRKLGAGPVWALVVSVAGWFIFVSAAFLSDTLAVGVVPTGDTIASGVNLWARGVQLVILRPAPTFAEAGLLLLTVTGVWAIAHAVEGLVFRLRAPLPAIAVALVLWVVPLVVAPPSGAAWPWAVTFLGAAALLLLAFVGRDVDGWSGADAATRSALYPTGTLVAVTAIIAGVLLASSVPGYGRAPWFETRGLGGTTLTTNPIVDIRARLVAGDSGPVLRVSTPRPLYLRVTSLDTYSENEEWTNAGIQGTPISGPVPIEVPIGARETVRVSVEVENLSEAVLVPAPYQVTQVAGEVADRFQYDRRNATLTLDKGATLDSGDRYSVLASIPTPTVEALSSVANVRPDPAYTALPDNVPPAVGELARRIVADADAETPFDQALAIQNELRTWTYSTEPPQGHSAQAMEQFLSTRTGYCEQFAGTMAVMLRMLGIPSRVAVGYSPGQLVGEPSNAASGTYVVSNANAHAWVEVLFPGMGWVSFEPTPRSDGNVLVPSATNLAPERTAGQQSNAPREETFGAPEERLPRNTGDDDPTEPPAPPVAAGPEQGGGGASVPTAIGLVLLAAVVVVAGIAVASRRDHDGLVPSGPVLRARARVERVGRGLGVAPSASDTDLEYLSRVAAVAGEEALDPAQRLAAATAAARYAPRIPAGASDDATSAAAQIVRLLVRKVSLLRRGFIAVRGHIGAALARVPINNPVQWLSHRSLSWRRATRR